jgi:hypothetical protein
VISPNNRFARTPIFFDILQTCFIGWFEVIALYSYREFLELQRKSLEHLHEKMKKADEKAQKEKKGIKNETPNEEAPLGTNITKT